MPPGSGDRCGLAKAVAAANPKAWHQCGNAKQKNTSGRPAVVTVTLFKTLFINCISKAI